MKKALIISGGRIERDLCLRLLEPAGAARPEYDLLIAADRGLDFLKKNGIRPTHIVGDFDSAAFASPEDYRDDPEVEIRLFRPEKDWTDTELAVDLALEEGCGLIDILGGTGSRLDHVLANIQVLALAAERGACCRILDPSNRISLRTRSFTMKRSGQWGRYVSLFAYGGDVTGLTLRGFHYEVTDFCLGTVGSRGVSNEIEAEEASVSFDSGRLLVIESRD